MTRDEFLDTTFYYYHGLVKQYLFLEGGRPTDKKETAQTFDKLPKGAW